MGLHRRRPAFAVDRQDVLRAGRERHIAVHLDDGSWTPRVEDLPDYDEPICPIPRGAE